MKVLSVNAGSSSFKFRMYEMPEEKVIISGRFERIGDRKNSFYSIELNGEKVEKKAELGSHADAVEILINELIENKVIESLDELTAISHRLVHGGDKYPNSVILDEDSLKVVESFTDLAPLHVPANVMCVRAFMEKAPKAVQVGCFDTAFHQTIDKERYIYPVPYEWYEKYKVRKYGFHGQSHKFIAQTIGKILNKEDVNAIICHIGQGASISAIENGKCIDTSMGFTPNSGVVMGTRSGDIDYGIIKYMMSEAGMTFDEVDQALNKKSGLLGLSKVSNDWRDVDDAITEGNKQAYLAHKILVNSIVDYVARYFVELKGQVDALVFTAGLGENANHIRRMVIDRLNCLGFECDREANDETRFGKEGIISSKNSKIPVYVIATNEELMMARDAVDLIK